MEAFTLDLHGSYGENADAVSKRLLVGVGGGGGEYSFDNHLSLFKKEHSTENVTLINSDLIALTASTLAPTAALELTRSYNDCIAFYGQIRNELTDSISLINLISYFIISIGILFNVLNLIVLLNSKLNESPYTYLTVLAVSDLGALLMLAIEKLRQSLVSGSPERNTYIELGFIVFITPLLNIFLSCSMYVTLALTIERFIFVHSPFKAMSICHRSIARRVCMVVFVFSFLRSIYLPFVYERNKCVPGAFNQVKIKALDIYEFLISLAIPYTVIFFVNISLIFSLNKQNSLMSLTRNQSFIFTNNHNASNPNLPIALAGHLRRTSSANTLEAQKLFEEKETTPTAAGNPNETVMKSATRQSLDSSNEQHETSRRCSIPALVSTIIKPCKLYHRTSSTKEQKNQKKLTASLIMVLCSLLVCYAPSFLFEESLVDVVFGELNYQSQTEETARLFKLRSIGFRVSLLFIYANCSFNFLIYCISNKKFKNSLKVLVKRSYMYNYFKTKRSCFNTKQQLGTIKYTMKRQDSRNWQELIILNRTAAEVARPHSSRNTSISTRLTNSLRSSCEIHNNNVLVPQVQNQSFI